MDQERVKHLCQILNELRYSNPPRLLEAAEIYARTGIGFRPDLQRDLLPFLGWSKSWFLKFNYISRNFTLYRNRHRAPTSFLALCELRHAHGDNLEILFDRGMVTPATTAAEAKSLVKRYGLSSSAFSPKAKVDSGRSIEHSKRNKRRSKTFLPLSREADIRLARMEKRSVWRKAKVIQRLLKGTIDDFLEACVQCDRFIFQNPHSVAILCEYLSMAPSTLFKLRRCARIAEFCEDTRNLPTRMNALYSISKLRTCDLEVALRHGIFSRKTTAKQVPDIVEEFRKRTGLMRPLPGRNTEVK